MRKLHPCGLRICMRIHGAVNVRAAFMAWSQRERGRPRGEQGWDVSDAKPHLHTVFCCGRAGGDRVEHSVGRVRSIEADPFNVVSGVGQRAAPKTAK